MSIRTVTAGSEELKMNKMLQKSLVAVAMVAVVLPVLIIGGMPMKVLLSVLLIIAASESASLTDQKQHLDLTAVTAAAMIALAFVSPAYVLVVPASYIVVLFLLVILDENKTTDMAAYAFIIAVICGLGVRSVLKTYEVSGTDSFRTMIYICIACFGCDTGAYFAGVKFGKHKMIPRISPNKTWEGAVGGYLTGAVLSFCFALLMIHVLPVPMLAAGSLILPAAAEIGDLSFSSLKRRFGIKDFSNMFPGHGGVLDRVDSILFCLMVFQGLLTIWGL